MKRIHLLYEYCLLPIRVLCFGLVLLAFGTLIQSDNLNIYYTFTNTYLLLIAGVAKSVGEGIVKLLPLIFMLNLVSKRANSGAPMMFGLCGYIIFEVCTMIFSSESYPSYVYSSIFGLSLDMSTLPLGGSGIRYPLNTGIIGAFIVAFITRFTYIRTRNRSSYAFVGFLNKDTANLIYNLILCPLAGFIVALIYPSFYYFLQRCISHISRNLTDPWNMAAYGFLDRFLSLCGLSDLIRYPFWFTSMGGSYQSVAGNNILGDVSIWSYISEIGRSFSGCGRFITAYYCINIFVIPAVYLGIYTSISNKKNRRSQLVFFIASVLVSILCGNPLVIEYLMFFSAPLLYLLYMIVVVGVFAVCSSRGFYLGFSYEEGNTALALPGNFPDYIINLRNAYYSDAVYQIAIVGVAFAVLGFLIVFIYYRYLSYGLFDTLKKNNFYKSLTEAVGGEENISGADANLNRLNVSLNDLEAVSFKKIEAIGARRLTETKTGISLDIGSSAPLLARYINKEIKGRQRVS